MDADEPVRAGSDHRDQGDQGMVCGDREVPRGCGRAAALETLLDDGDSIHVGVDFSREGVRVPQFRYRLDPEAGRAARAPEGRAGIVDGAAQGGEVRTGRNAAGRGGRGPFAFERSPGRWLIVRCPAPAPARDEGSRCWRRSATGRLRDRLLKARSTRSACG